MSRSFREAPRVADEIMAVLQEGLTVQAASSRVWAKLWPLEKRTQVGGEVVTGCAGFWGVPVWCGAVC